MLFLSKFLFYFTLHMKVVMETELWIHRHFNTSLKKNTHIAL